MKETMICDYNLRKKHHYCVRCGKQDAYTLNGRAKCFECTEKVNEYHRNKKYDEKYAVKRKAIRDERKSQGLCIVCGKKAEAGRIRCSKHLYKDRQSHKPKEIGRTLASELGICTTCLKNPALIGCKLCEACYNKSLASLEKARENADVSKYKNFRFGRKYESYLNGEF